MPAFIASSPEHLCVKCRSATDEVERILAIQKNYYAVLKVQLTSSASHRGPPLTEAFHCVFGHSACALYQAKASPYVTTMSLCLTPLMHEVITRGGLLSWLTIAKL